MNIYNNKSYGVNTYMTKFLLMMKLIIAMMTTVFLQFSFAVEAQKITIQEQNAPIEKIFKQIRQQTGYDFFCDLKTLREAKKVTISIKNATLEEVLNQVLTSQNLSYSINDKIITVKSNEKKAFGVTLLQDSILFAGRIYDERGYPLQGATVKVKNGKKISRSTAAGNFAIYTTRTSIIIVSFVGYSNKEIDLKNENPERLIEVNMTTAIKDLGEVNIVSTGYQDLPKERATGTFEVVTAKQLEHSNNPNLIKRLEGITTSMDFNNQNQPTLSSIAGSKRSPLTNLTIRGRNSIARPGLAVDLSNNSGQPLVVINGIATPYSIDNINPNDVESITILKDAASSSIWGSRAANGVIVIKTKRGKYNNPVNVYFNSNVNITEKANLFYKKFMSTSDLIDAQMSRYENIYDPTDPDAFLPNPDPDSYDLYIPQLPMSQVEEIMNDHKMGEITLEERNARLDALRGNDVRRDLSKYFLRKSVFQNYTLSVDGGSDLFSYRLSGSYDKSLNNTVTSDGDRYNFNYSTGIKPAKNLEIQAIVGYTQTNTNDQAGDNNVLGSSSTLGFDPYVRLADDQGNPLTVIKNYRPKYLSMISERYGDKILDMSFSPLQDMHEGYYKTKTHDLNLNLNATYTFSRIFSGSLTYSYNWSLAERNELKTGNRFFMRELINIFTTREDYVDPFLGFQPLRRIIPEGGLLSTNQQRSNTQTLRAQLNANKSWGEKHVLSAIAGADVNQFFSLTNNSQLYGFNPQTLNNNTNIPFGTVLTRLIGDPLTGLEFDQIPYNPSLMDFKTRAISFYSNAAYTFDKRYTFSASLRKDISSVFGSSTNKKGSPYYSFGGSWNINNEKFYPIQWLPTLQFRVTYGFNGNGNPSIVAVPIISYNEAPTSGGNQLPYVTIGPSVNNPLLRPEKSGIFNIGLNFGIKNNRLSGSIDYYIRNTKDLLSAAAIDPTNGYNNVVYNSANLRGKGLDISLSSINVESGNFRWGSNLLFSHNRVTIKKLFSPTSLTASQLVNTTQINIEGYDLSRMAAYRWAGLDPETGDPRGYVNGMPTPITGDAAGYTGLDASPINSTVKIFGSSVPLYYGALRNTFNYANFSLSVNFLYKLGYYSRRPISDLIRYDLLFTDNVLGGAEFAQRWQKPGDELITNVPSLTFPTNFYRDEFYRLSEINVIKADHIRFQEVNLAYTFKNVSHFLKTPRLYANVTNLGIIWRANKLNIDPEANDYPQPRTYGLGFSANF